MKELSEKDYVVAIERHLGKLRARPLVLSPADFERVLDWFARGIPLSLVTSVMSEVFAQAASRKPLRLPRSLAYCAPAVEEAFADLQAGRTRPRGSRDPVEADDSRAAVAEMGRAVAASSAPREIREEIAGLLEKASAGEAVVELGEDLASNLERRLFEACLAALSCEERRELEQQALEDVEPYADGMDPAVREHACRRALQRRLRRRFRLPDLSLLPLLGP
ncbi:MAG: hypothetical protein Q9Q40_03435 [Acidobacteriota bacterium]|nr:hypothetical protein [Acidobacteriota bacterium]MDQ7086727.1 hypothetical protein [Acidobacteriota bacterium]